MAMQLDVAYIMRKLIFLDSAISKLMEDHELEALYLREKPNIKQVKSQRKLHFMPELFERKEKGSEHEGVGSLQNIQMRN